MNAQDKFLEENQPKVESQKLRAAASGLFMGWADELEAGARALLLEDRPYEEIRDEIRGQVKAYQEANPGESFTFEALGAAAPTALMLLVPGGQAAGAANVTRLAGSVRSLVAQGAKEGAVTGAGESEADSLLGVAGDTATGSLAGAVISPVVGTGAEKALNLTSRLSSALRQFGGRPSDAAMAEIDRLARGTGKSRDEIIQDIMDGRIVAENQTLAATVRAMRSKGPDEAGKTGALIDRGLRGRAEATAERAREASERALFPGANARNVFEVFNEADAVLKRAERRGYQDVFRANQTVDDGTASAFEKLAQRFPNLTKELDEYYRENNLVPLFKQGEGGALEMVRIPSLQDSEVFYRLMRDEADARWAAGKGQTAEPLSNAVASWKRMLDIKFPELKQVRIDSAQRFTGKKAFNEGRKAFGGDTEMKMFEFDQLGAEAQQAYRAGMLAAWKNKMRVSGTAAARGADVTKKEGAMLKHVLGDDFENILKKELEIAGEAAEAVNRVLYGSATAPQLAAEKAVGTGQFSRADIVGAYGGDPITIAAAIGKLLASEEPSLQPKDYEAVTKFLMSEDPDFVAGMLNDTVAYGVAADRIKRAIATVGEAGRAAATVTGSGGTSQAISPGTQSLIDMATGGMAP